MCIVAPAVFAAGFLPRRFQDTGGKTAGATSWPQSVCLADSGT
jgi:hypothetical protein